MVFMMSATGWRVHNLTVIVHIVPTVASKRGGRAGRQNDGGDHDQENFLHWKSIWRNESGREHKLHH